MLPAHITHERLLMHVTTGLLLGGALVFLSGIFVIAPTPSLEEGLHTAATLPPGTASSVYLLGTILLVAGATLDVWRRLGNA